MARSSGGGSRSGGGGGSRSSGGSRSGGSSGIRISDTPFRGSRTFRYYRNGTTHYVYSDRDLRSMKDPKPRWLLILFYIPFLFAIFSMFSGSIIIPQKPLSAYNSQDVALIDTADVFTIQEEEAVSVKLKEFSDTTGIATQIITIGYDEWEDNGTLENYALARYYTQFDDENGWLIVYSEEDDGAGDWSWEGIQGDNTYKVMNAFLNDFNTHFQSQLVVNQTPDPANALIIAFDKSITAFENQSVKFEFELMLPAFGMLAFILFHGYIMIFAGTRKKYSYSELEEVTNNQSSDTNNYGCKYDISKSDLNAAEVEIIECRYCGCKYDHMKDHKCPNCAAIN